MRLFAISLIICGFFFLIMQLIFSSRLLIILGIVNITIGFYFLKRFVEIEKIDDDSVTFGLGEKEVRLLKENIISVTKAVRFTVTENYLLMITFYNIDKNKKERYFFMNDPEFNLLESFKNMGVKLRNVP